MLTGLPLNVWLLAITFALFMSLSAMIFFIGGIVGKTLTTNTELSTLPVALLLVGSTISLIWVINLMSAIGRKKAFIVISIYTFVVCWLATLALMLESFWLFCLAAFLTGATVACMNQFRFAAIENVTKPFYVKATSVVLLGGLSAAFLGPEIALIGKNILTTEFAGSFALISIFFLISAIIFIFYTHNKPAKVQESSKPTRSIIHIIHQKVFIVAVVSAIIAYAIMSYIMTAAPISMHSLHGHSLTQIKFSIQTHIIAMFAPSLFTTWIVKKINLNNMMLAGAIIYILCVIIAYSGHTAGHYLWSLILLGIGWNFLFVGATIMLPVAYNENEKYKTQLFNDLTIFSVQAFAALSAGWFVFKFGWQTVILSIVPILIVQVILLLYYIQVKKIIKA